MSRKAGAIHNASVAASRLVTAEVIALNKENFKDNPYTPVYAHSQGTAIANLAIDGLSPKEQGWIDLRNVGTATGLVPAYLHSYRSIENTLDSTPMIVSKLAGLGGVTTSPGYLKGVADGRDYQVVNTTFDVAGDRFNHSLPYYFTDPVA